MVPAPSIPQPLPWTSNTLTMNSKPKSPNIAVTGEMVDAGEVAGEYTSDQYGGTSRIPRDVVKRIIVAALGAQPDE